jgi:hypothetical protein
MENFPGKGGWTFVQIPEVMQNKDNPFGWVKVRGFIDDYEINHYNLQPMGNGNLFLPIKSEIRLKNNQEIRLGWFYSKKTAQSIYRKKC